jgi:hypothetical protein
VQEDPQRGPQDRLEAWNAVQEQHREGIGEPEDTPRYRAPGPLGILGELRARHPNRCRPWRAGATEGARW